MSKSKTIFRDKSVFFTVLFFAALVIAYQLRSVNGYWGHDYYYSLTRLFVGSVHFWKNPFSLPHYTASLCGGIPFFADPQNPYFSIPQALSLFIEPLYATHVTYFLAYVVAFTGMTRLLHLGLKLQNAVARFGALLFVLNGFLFENFFVGHLSHHSYVLFPWILLQLINVPSKVRTTFFSNNILLSLEISYLVYSGGFHMLIALSMLLFIVGPFLFQHQIKEGDLKAWLKQLSISGMLIVFICAGKLIASWLYAKNFYVNPLHISQFNIFDLVAKYFWFRPEGMADMRRFGNMLLGPWEYVGFISKITIPLLVIGMFSLLRRQALLKLAGGIPAVLVLLWACGKGGNAFIPVLKLYHNPIKLLAVFIIPVIMVSACGASKILELSRGWSIWSFRKLGFALVNLFLLIEFSYYTEYFRHHPYLSNYLHAMDLYPFLKVKGLTPVKSVVTEKGWDIVGLAIGCTSLKCYEPLFGYEYQNLEAKLGPGKTSRIEQGAFNINHPGCLLYPEYFKCSAWDPVPASQVNQFADFTQGKDPWGIPPWHTAVYRLNFFCFILLIVVRLVLFFSKTFTYKKDFSAMFARTIRTQ